MIRVSFKIGGIVQGVGFRPFIHKLVNEYGLKGWVKNTSFGVEMELEGNDEILYVFKEDIIRKKPMLAEIEYVKVEKLKGLIGYNDFKIIKSTGQQEKTALISPDVCICDDCLEELKDPSNRRYRFPFINCTNCGPRFTIIKDIPYDRNKTTMNSFPMCESCNEEYTDIENRRYHAQPDCCFDCGPKLFFLNDRGNKLEGDPIELAREYIKEGKIIAVKGLGGMHLACSCESQDIALRLRKRKHRDEKPFAIMCRNVESAERLCFISEEEKKLLTSYRRPIVLLKKRKEGMEHISENQYIGIMLPYTPVHYMLMDEDIDYLIMTSANISDMPIIYKNDEAVEKLKGIADGFLLNNRDIHVRCDDSLIRIFEGREYPLRRSRGYVPFPIKLNHPVEGVLACGGEQKASFALTKGSYVFLSQHIGDLKNMETLENYEEQVEHFKRLFDINVTHIACDLHPDYLSTSYAEKIADHENIPILRIQHHFAHMASCMGDNGLDESCIGIIWDGTGYGTDGTIWGGEFLAGDYKGFERAGTIRTMLLPGGDAAIKEIYRVACSLMEDAGCSDKFDYDAKKSSLIREMMKLGINCPKTTSIGRLFDGICAIIGIRETVSYEGQGAILLEAASEPSEDDYDYEIYSDEGRLVFDYRALVREAAEDKAKGVSVGIIASKFMNTLSHMAVTISMGIRERTGLNLVVLSGGVFQNMYLLGRLKRQLEKQGFKVYTHSRVSANDEGISLGQALIAGRREA